MSYGLTTLNLSNVGLSKKVASNLATALRKNIHISTTLTSLDISNNPNIGIEGVASLSDFFAQPNTLKSLNLSNTTQNIDGKRTIKKKKRNKR